MPVCSYISVPDAPAAFSFYEAAFGADVFHRGEGDDEKNVHARFRIVDSVIMLYEHTPGEPPGIVTPDAAGMTTVTLRVLLETRAAADRVFDGARAHGAKIGAAPENVPWNEYYGRLTDPFGHAWAFGALIEAQGE